MTESRGGALELALDTRENVFHGGGGGDGKRVVPVNVIFGVRGRDRGREKVLAHICILNRLRRDGAPRRVDDVGNRIVDVVVVGVELHAIMQDWSVVLVKIGREGGSALFRLHKFCFGYMKSGRWFRRVFGGIAFGFKLPF